MKSASLGKGVTVSGQVAPDVVRRFVGEGVRRIVSVGPDRKRSDQFTAMEATWFAAERGIEHVHGPVAMRAVSMDAARAITDALDDGGASARTHRGSALRTAPLRGFGQDAAGSPIRDEAAHRMAAAGFSLKPGPHCLGARGQGALA